jgi:hypothetical protein
MSESKFNFSLITILVLVLLCPALTFSQDEIWIQMLVLPLIFMNTQMATG